jgi:DNA-binding XRE family transcriptional regulator
MKNNIKELRIKQGLTKYALASKSGVTRQYIALIEKEEHEPSLCVLIKIATALNVSVNQLTEIP